MTVPDTVRVSGPYTGTGATNVFTYSFFIFLQTHLLVQVFSPGGTAPTTLTLSTDGITGDYTVQGVLSKTGTITLLANGQAWMTGSALSAGWQILLSRVLPIIQTTNVRGENRFNPETLENTYDEIVMMIQQLSAGFGSAAPSGGGTGGGGVQLSNKTPLIENGSGSPGTGLFASREDHVHPAQATVGPATVSTLGTIQLAGDLSGTATNPTVPGLGAIASKVPTSRNINTTAPIHGGGNLSADLSLTFNPAEVPLDTLGATTDITTLNSSTTAHGLLRKLDNNVAHFLNGTGAWSSIPSPTWWFGTGADGALTLVGDTTLASGQFIFNYTSITLNGHTLTCADRNTRIYCQGTLDFGGGGSIVSGRTADTAQPASTSPAGRGGIGGGAGGALWVLFKNMAGTGTIDASGKAGGNGGDATAWVAGTSGGQSGTNGAISGFYIYGNNYNGLSAAIHASGTGDAQGGAGGGGPTATNKLPLTDILNVLYATQSRPDLTGPWTNQGNPGASSTNGTASVGAALLPASGGAGGGAGIWAGGGAGGNSDNTAGVTANDGASGGAGGASGGGGGLAVAVCPNVLSTLTVTANGGNGGNGGHYGGPHAIGDAGGGGGGGAGLAILIGQAGNTAAVTANGGTGGTVHGVLAVVGTAGGNGLALSLVGF